MVLQVIAWKFLESNQGLHHGSRSRLPEKLPKREFRFNLGV